MKTLKKLLWIVSIALLVLIGSFTLSYTWTDTAMRHAPQENEKRVHRAVYTACEYSRSINSGEAEYICGELQDETNTLFNCADGRCWVEELY